MDFPLPVFEKAAVQKRPDPDNWDSLVVWSILCSGPMSNTCTWLKTELAIHAKMWQGSVHMSQIMCPVLLRVLVSECAQQEKCAV